VRQVRCAANVLKDPAIFQFMGDRDLVDRLIALKEVVARLETLAIDLAIKIISRKIARDLGDRMAVNQDGAEY
jgi:hypothetical protein